MDDLSCFSFNRELSAKEIEYWDKFFKDFPGEYVPYFNSAITAFANHTEYFKKYFEYSRYLEKSVELLGMLNSDINYFANCLTPKQYGLSRKIETKQKTRKI